MRANARRYNSAIRLPGSISFVRVANFRNIPDPKTGKPSNKPAEVLLKLDVYIDGQRVTTLRLPAGDFDLRDITQAPGLRNVQLVIRDSFGREQKISAPFYSTQVPLKTGLHEYSYNLGAVRQMYGVESNDCGPLAFAGFHRYGVTDSLTLGAHGEGKSGVYNAGATATVVLGTAGLLNVSGAASGNDGRSGGGALASYTYSGTHFNAGLLLRKQARTTPKRNYEINATVGYTDVVVGSISAGYSTLKTYGGQDSSSASLSYGRPLFDGRASFFVTVMSTRGQDSNTNVFAGFVYNFDANYAVSARYERFQGINTEAAQFQKAQPVGDGLGYTIAAESVGSPEGTATVFTPSFQYNSRWGILRGSALQQMRANFIGVETGVTGRRVLAKLPHTISLGQKNLAVFHHHDRHTRHFPCLPRRIDVFVKYLGLALTKCK